MQSVPRRGRLWVGGLSAVSLVIAGCDGGGEDDADPEPGATPSSSAGSGSTTTTPGAGAPSGSTSPLPTTPPVEGREIDGVDGLTITIPDFYEVEDVAANGLYAERRGINLPAETIAVRSALLTSPSAVEEGYRAFRRTAGHLVRPPRVADTTIDGVTAWHVGGPVASNIVTEAFGFPAGLQLISIELRFGETFPKARREAMVAAVLGSIEIDNS